MLSVLLRHGADPEAKNNDGHTALYEAQVEGKKEIAATLKKILQRIRSSGDSSDKAERQQLVDEVLDGKWEPEAKTPDPAPPPAMDAKPSTRVRSKFSSQRAGLRVKTSIEIAKEERQSQPKDTKPAPKSKSRILQPSSSAAFGGL